MTEQKNIQPASRWFMSRQILSLAIPSVISNVTVPLLGLVDLTIVGHIGDDAYISAIATGSMIFNVIYWIFGFLRMGTSGMTAQAYGRRSRSGTDRVLRLAEFTGLSIGLLFVLLQHFIIVFMLWAMNTPATAVPLVRQYFGIVIWGAPAMLGLYALNGWFVGMQDTRITMMTAIFQNIVNIIASLFFVFGLHMKIDGVAFGTLIAQWSGFVMALAFMAYKRRHSGLSSDECGNDVARLSLGRFFTVNRDIFLRTLCLVAVNMFFTSAGGRQGTLILAVNALLMTLYTLFSYFMDGFAFAAEALCGKYYGAADYANLRRLLNNLYLWGLAMVVVFTLLYMVGGSPFLSLLTDDTNVVRAASGYLMWACAIPVCGVLAFIYDGVFIGLTATRGMLVSSAMASVLFFAVYFLLSPSFGNNALWMAFLLFLACRGAVQWFVLYHFRLVSVR